MFIVVATFWFFGLLLRHFGLCLSFKHFGLLAFISSSVDYLGMSSISIIFVYLCHLGLFYLLKVHHLSTLVVHHSNNCSPIRCVICCCCISVCFGFCWSIWFMLVIHAFWSTCLIFSSVNYLGMFSIAIIFVYFFHLGLSCLLNN